MEIKLRKQTITVKGLTLLSSPVATDTVTDDAMKIAWQATKQGYGATYLSLYENKADIKERMIAVVTGTPLGKVCSGKVTNRQAALIADVREEIDRVTAYDLLDLTSPEVSPSDPLITRIFELYALKVEVLAQTTVKDKGGKGLLYVIDDLNALTTNSDPKKVIELLRSLVMNSAGYLDFLLLSYSPKNKGWLLHAVDCVYELKKDGGVETTKNRYNKESLKSLKKSNAK